MVEQPSYEALYMLCFALVLLGAVAGIYFLLNRYLLYNPKTDTPSSNRHRALPQKRRRTKQFPIPVQEVRYRTSGHGNTWVVEIPDYLIGVIDFFKDRGNFHTRAEALRAALHSIGTLRPYIQNDAGQNFVIVLSPQGGFVIQKLPLAHHPPNH